MEDETIPTPTIGGILKEEFLDPMGITPYRLSKEINVSTSSVLDLVHDRRKLSVEMALRLSRFFGNSHKFWLNLQNEIESRELEAKMKGDLEKIHVYSQTA